MILLVNNFDNWLGERITEGAGDAEGHAFGAVGAGLGFLHFVRCFVFLFFLNA